MIIIGFSGIITDPIYPQTTNIFHLSRAVYIVYVRAYICNCHLYLSWEEKNDKHELLRPFQDISWHRGKRKPDLVQRGRSCSQINLMLLSSCHHNSREFTEKENNREQERRRIVVFFPCVYPESNVIHFSFNKKNKQPATTSTTTIAKDGVL